MKVDLSMLKKLCLMREKSLKKYIRKTVPGIIDWDRFMYKKNADSKILAVAHMDTSLELSEFHSFDTPNDIIVVSPALDDRLGIYTMLHLLPQFGITADFLFTTDEEKCASTATEFADYCQKDYNWMVEFDRRGSDVVLYGYDTNQDLVDGLKLAGFETGDGTYSDICDLESLHVSAFNMGIGYHFQHTTHCTGSLLELSEQLKKLQVFYRKFMSVPFTHKPRPITKKYITKIYGKGCGDYSEEDRKRDDQWWGTASCDKYKSKPKETSVVEDEQPEDRNFLWDYGKVNRACQAENK